MHAIVVSVTVHDPERATSNLREQVVPRISSAPGFVAGYWVALGPEKGGRAVIVCESEQAARDLAAQIEAPEGLVTIDSVDVGEVIANA